MRATIAVPETMIADANQLARALGLGPDDDATFGAPIWQDAGGDRYAAASMVVGEGWLDLLAAPLAAPSWGADMAAAERARAAVQVGAPAGAGRIAVCVAEPASAGLAALGITPVEEA
jgi:hypothetical protein